MDKPVRIALPFLRGYTKDQMLRLWPGHDEAPSGYWQPPDFPLSRDQARAWLDSMSRIDALDMETMRLEIIKSDMGAEIGFIDEMAELARFRGLKTDSGALSLIRIQSQKVLLWRWRLEEITEEIEALEWQCHAAESSLRARLSDPLAGKAPRWGSGPAESMESGSDASLESGWETVVANAAFFIPASIPICVSPGAAADIKDRLDAELADRALPDGAIRAPLWKVIGKSRPLATCLPPFNSVFNEDRLWLGIQ